MNRPVLAVLVAVVLGTVAACTSGGAPPEPEQTSSRTQPQPTSPPPITRPLDASAYRDRVCDLLTDDQAAKHGVDKLEETGEEPDFAICTPRRDRTLLGLYYYYDTDLLGAIYRHEVLLWKNSTLVALTAAGQPAVRAESGDPEYCKLAVGLSDTQGIQITLSLAKGRDDACDRVVAVAEDIVHNLGG